MYASRARIATERNYAQIEKQLLAIVFVCKKFDQYVYGREKVHMQSYQGAYAELSRCICRVIKVHMQSYQGAYAELS